MVSRRLILFGISNIYHSRMHAIWTWKFRCLWSCTVLDMSSAKRVNTHRFATADPLRSKCATIPYFLRHRAYQGRHKYALQILSIECFFELTDLEGDYMNRTSFLQDQNNNPPIALCGLAQNIGKQTVISVRCKLSSKFTQGAQSIFAVRCELINNTSRIIRNKSDASNNSFRSWQPKVLHSALCQPCKLHVYKCLRYMRAASKSLGNYLVVGKSRSQREFFSAAMSY